ncbi:DUF2971 domain-containing protein [Vibrio parahaemolyticus]|uniref:DUF2971 domain-containing protein n=1 Tax=Vibrio parahaemolyticus TaxID=670 RepID=UPI0008131AA1|nr:DUF2971 domain-containing protein [Vibrio parahaemolyticus]EIE9605329.1 DUF2971 domain-containing protein [Vibrio parahaemolyticus]EKK9973120.1 DUF2971 domain-containing protein [Vibrio parahaemolyticus]OCQ06666.1 hypothetical protein AKH16_14140 [Vibrio parahaemolyticus]
MKLFKYLQPARIDVLKNKSIRFSQPSAFNDPFEFKPVISTVASPEYFQNYFINNFDVLVDEQLSKLPVHLRSQVSKSDLRDMLGGILASNHNPVSEILKNTGAVVSDVLTEKSNELIGVLSLTEKYDNLLMWAHYADSHRGFCLGFDASAEFFNRKRSEKDEFYHLRKVQYSDKRPSKSMMDMSPTEMFLLKSNEWKYEQEWRMCSVLTDASSVNEQITPAAYLFDFPCSTVTEVIVGANADEALITSIHETLNSEPEFSHVKFKRAKVSRTDFALEFDDL